jgi:FtsP/CotA-like multicopper oxidase with cupredoxin domain
MEQGVTRRALVTGAAALLAAPARAQDGFRVIRAAEPVPGPVLRINRGEELRVRFVNDGPAAASLHWHGVRVPNAMDGVPPLTQKPVGPSESFDYRFTPPDAGTFWYRAPFGAGPYGALIVEEPQPVDVDRDVVFLLDGATAPDIAFGSNERVRVRLINVGDRLATVSIERHPVRVMAIDGQPAEPFLAREGRITLAPGNRADLFVDTGTRHGEPKPLPANPLPARMDFRGALRAEIDVSAANENVPAKPLFSVKRGRTVQFAMRGGATASSLHVHGHHVRLLDALDDGWKPFWLDTILVMPQQVTRVAFVADNPGKWLLHGRQIGNGAQSIAWFEVS